MFNTKKVNKTTYSLTNNIKEDNLTIEIGDIKQPDFKPQVKLMRWNNEVNLSVRLLDTDQNISDVSLQNNKISWKKGGLKTNFYNTPKKDKETLDIPTVTDTTTRFISMGIVDIVDLPAIHEVFRHTSPTKPVLITCKPNPDQIGFAFFGQTPADKELKNLDSMPYPIARFPVIDDSHCPISYISGRGILIDLYYPNIDTIKDHDLSAVDIALNKVLGNYGCSITRPNNLFKGHLIFFRDGVNLKRVGRTAYDRDHLSLCFYIDNPVIKELLNYVRDSAKLRDTFTLPKGGISELNPDIGYEILDLIARQLAVELNIPLEDSTITDEESNQINYYRNVFQKERYIKHAINSDNPPARDENTDGYEFEVEISSKPISNVLQFTIETKGLDFFYQPELTEEEKDLGAYRPENVVGSYAVYHKSNKGDYSQLGGNNYYSGKAFHIYRPKVTDSNGDWVWADLHIDEDSKLLTITIPQDFIDKAIYPVLLDPNFGLQTGGGSKLQLAGNSSSQYAYNGGVYTCPTNATIQSVTGYIDNANVTCDYIVYRSSDGVLVSYSANPTHSVAGTLEWNTASLTTPANPAVTNQDYVLGMTGGDPGKGGIGQISYDATGGSGRVLSWTPADNLSNTAPHNIPNPASFTTNTNKISIYATYTATGGGNTDTTKTITGKGSIAVTTTKTLTGLSRVTINTVKTLLGKANLLISTTKTILGKANILITKNYTKGFGASLPTDNSDLGTAFTGTDFNNVAVDDSSYSTEQVTSPNFSIFEFKNRNTDNVDQIVVNWKGKTDLDPAHSPVYLQIYNYNSSSWETLTFNNSATVGTDFTLASTKTNSLSNYYDGSFWVTCRVYQEIH